MSDQEEFDKAKKAYFDILNRTEEDIWIIIKNNDDDICRSKYPSECVLKLIQEYFKELKNA